MSYGHHGINGQQYDGLSYRTRNRYAQRIGEDMLDWMHRLAKSGATARTIAKRLDLDLDDVIYWMERNGYLEH